MSDDKKIDEAHEEKLLKKAKKFFKRATEADNHNRTAAVKILKFKNGDQWDEEVKQKRSNRGRPTLQINQLGKYSNQICGEGRKNKMQVSVRPRNTKASVELAKMRAGMIKDIEYYSNAEAIDDHTRKMLVDCGYGAFRICTRYTEENPFLQEIYYESIGNPLSVYMDPNCKDKDCHSDAKEALVYTKIPKEQFEEDYPDVELPSGSWWAKLMDAVGLGNELWWDKDSIVVAEYFYTEYDEKTMCQISDDQIMEKKDAEKFIANAKELAKKPEQISADDFAEPANDNANKKNVVQMPTIVKEKQVKEPKIKWCKLIGNKILKEEDWKGKYIPIVLVTGQKTNIEGKWFVSGLFKDSTDAQKMYNYWISAAAETIAMAPKAQWQSTPAMIEGHESDYADANEDNLPVMLYEVDPQSPPGAKPTRTSPGQVPTAILSEIDRASQNIKDTIGMFNIDVGDHGREMSGKAMFMRQMPGDTGTYIYHDIMAQAVMLRGKITNDLIKYYYDTARDVRIRQDDNTEQFAPINTTVGRAMDALNSNPLKYSGIDKSKLQQTMDKEGINADYNQITDGEYDVIITVGPTFATQRMEAFENMAKLAMTAKVSALDKYLLFKNGDFPGAQEAAEIYKRMVPPGLIPPKEGDKPLPPPQPSPQVQLLMAKAQVEVIKNKKEILKAQLELIKIQKEAAETEGGMKKIALDALAELNAPFHPADNMPMGANGM